MNVSNFVKTLSGIAGLGYLSLPVEASKGKYVRIYNGCVRWKLSTGWAAIKYLANCVEYGNIFCGWSKVIPVADDPGSNYYAYFNFDNILVKIETDNLVTIQYVFTDADDKVDEIRSSIVYEVL